MSGSAARLASLVGRHRWVVLFGLSLGLHAGLIGLIGGTATGGAAGAGTIEFALADAPAVPVEPEPERPAMTPPTSPTAKARPRPQHRAAASVPPAASADVAAAHDPIAPAPSAAAPAPADPDDGTTVEEATPPPATPPPPIAPAAVASPAVAVVHPGERAIVAVNERLTRAPWLDPGSCTDQLEYPFDAMRRGKEGTVRLLVSLDEHGKVLQAKVTGRVGFGLDEAALDAVLGRCRFAPARDAQERPTSSLIEHLFTFRIADFRR